ncbi:MAG: type III-B CRISPR module RAMP protein Cmr4 [Verrucomicrobiota bacterium JB025]|nr:type III-B CRISPR module RAMP protein Cmr4 [Verrucomicrobiota bacterium JB025]
MNTKILYLFTRTPLHVGAGASVGAIDQPVQRERHTGFPVIPGSSIKGVLADQSNALDESGKPLKDGDRNATMRTDDGARLFGLGAGKAKGDNGKAGSIGFGEAKLLAFPVRSAKGCFVWLTSPLALQRWARATGCKINVPEIKKDNKSYFNAATLGETLGNNANSSALFEDYVFHHAGEFDLAKTLAESCSNDPVWTTLAASHLALVDDSILSHFAVTACEVAQHVVIDDETGTAKEGLLFNQENVPAETLFYSSLTSSSTEDLNLLQIPNPLQVGGDATTGLGFCTTNRQ